MEDALRPYAARHGDSCRPRPGARLRLADVPPGCVRTRRAPDTGWTWCRGGDAGARASQAPLHDGQVRRGGTTSTRPDGTRLTRE